MRVVLFGVHMGALVLSLLPVRSRAYRVPKLGGPRRLQKPHEHKEADMVYSTWDRIL